MIEKDPLLSYRPVGPLRLEGVGSLECASSIATAERVCLRRVPCSPQAQAAIEAARAMPKHPALAAVLDAGTWQADAWLVTEFPEGPLLSAEAGKVRSVSDFLPLIDALAALHLKGISHGLISSEAVLVTAGGKLMLHEVAMLELNRATDRRPEQTLLAQLQRTAPFYSPQRLKGGPPALADDVYAVGALLCLHAGGTPLKRASVLEQLHAVMVGEWKPTPPVGIPEPQVRLLERMTAREPSLRPSITEVAARLRQTEAVEGPPILFPGPAPTAPGAPVFDPIPAPAPTAPYSSLMAGQLIAPAPPRPTVPVSPPRAARIQVGGAAAVRQTWLEALDRRISGFIVSIAASDPRLITAGVLALAMLSSTVALGAHVVSARQEAKEQAAALKVKPVAPKEPRYNAEQLKQILRQKEAAHHEY